MKKLLIILFFIPLFGSGQNYRIEPTPQFGFDTVYFTPTYVYDLIEYQKQCYNDSTYYIPQALPGIHILYSFDTTKVNFFEKIWIHKEPTFEGFIEFLKTKYKLK